MLRAVIPVFFQLWSDKFNIKFAVSFEKVNKLIETIFPSLSLKPTIFPSSVLQKS